MKYRSLKKVQSIKELQKYDLPMPQTIFIFNFKKQEKEIDEFLKNKRILTIRSDKRERTDFCPCILGCERKKAKQFIKKLTSGGYVGILQKYVPIRRDRVSGNILILKNYILVELMGTGPLTWLNRDGKVIEQVRFQKSNFKEINHFGKRLIRKKELINILKLLKRIPSYKILEFTLRPEGIYFWQIKGDKTAKKLENEIR